LIFGLAALLLILSSRLFVSAGEPPQSIDRRGVFRDGHDFIHHFARDTADVKAEDLRCLQLTLQDLGGFTVSYKRLIHRLQFLEDEREQVWRSLPV
jgi:hypothetical protein